MFKLRSFISQSCKQLSEYQMAQNYYNKGLHNEAHDLYLQAIRILRNYENPTDLYLMAYKNSQYLELKKQNEILIYGNQNLQTYLLYFKNRLYYDPFNAFDELTIKYTLFTQQFDKFLYHELLLIAKLANFQKNTQKEIQKMKENVSDQTQHRLIYSDCINGWLSQFTEFSPIYLNNPLQQEKSIKIFEKFKNTLTHLNQMPFKLADRFLKSFADFIINDNIQNVDKAVVGQVAKQYLQYMEVHKPDHIYKPLFLLGWLNLKENKKLVAEGLFRNIDELIEKLPQSSESQLVRAQMSVQYIDLLKQFDKRQTEQQNLNNYVNSLKIPISAQLMSLYLDYQDYEVQF